MTGFLDRLAAHAEGLIPTVQPRLRSRFEPVADARAASFGEVDTEYETSTVQERDRPVPGSDTRATGSPSTRVSLQEIRQVRADRAAAKLSEPAVPQARPQHVVARSSDPVATVTRDGGNAEMTTSRTEGAVGLPSDQGTSDSGGAKHPAASPVETSTPAARQRRSDLDRLATVGQAVGKATVEETTGEGGGSVREATEGRSRTPRDMTGQVRSSPDDATSPTASTRAQRRRSTHAQQSRVPAAGSALPPANDQVRHRAAAVPGDEETANRGAPAQQPSAPAEDLPVPSMYDLIHHHVVPALGDAGLLSPGARVEVVDDPVRARAVSSGRPGVDVVAVPDDPVLTRPDPVRGGPAQVNVTIGRVKVVRAAPRPATRPDPPARPAGPDHEAYLARRREDAR